jgi:hypothetical protein
MWSVWDESPTISWRFDGGDVKITLRLPPVSVVALQNCGVIAVAGNAAEFGGNNLLFYTYEGKLLRVYSAPLLGEKAQFLGVSETNGEVIGTVAYECDEGVWIEVAGTLNLETGVLTELHRSY